MAGALLPRWRGSTIPGPQDSHYLFTRFLNLVRKEKGIAEWPEHKAPAA